ncbi:hypothetical protein DEU56DRAFT_594128 [Suillus clintonianus]|uniref:uncharacterized protein n=1 Tax=Suillus clintonianus TaxID=1904413 RepID=UPI001B8660FC|nr:uncharacterized protein DEU56DRAFT_594128 [Suillus clintonianus]KAG2124621.1 hypothetical protein DEU56DRAFT_594128 [Suillus clintonianus]
MSLFKIPFIVGLAIGVYVSFTSSAPPPSPGEFVEPPAFETFMTWPLRRLGRLGIDTKKVFVWAASFAEVASILATHINSSQLPEGTYGARALQLLCSLHPTPITPAFIAGSLAFIIGGVIRRHCVVTLGKHWSWPISVRKDHTLVTNGPYSFVRHPSYTGFILQYIGLVVMYGHRESWLRQSGFLQVPFVKVITATGFYAFTLGTFICIIRPAVEDKMLRSALGKEWEDWAKRVKYRLLPGVY